MLVQLRQFVLNVAQQQVRTGGFLRTVRMVLAIEFICPRMLLKHRWSSRRSERPDAGEVVKEQITSLNNQFEYNANGELPARRRNNKGAQETDSMEEEFWRRAKKSERVDETGCSRRIPGGAVSTASNRPTFVGDSARVRPVFQVDRDCRPADTGRWSRDGDETPANEATPAPRSCCFAAACHRRPMGQATWPGGTKDGFLMIVTGCLLFVAKGCETVSQSVSLLILSGRPTDRPTGRPGGRSMMVKSLFVK